MDILLLNENQELLLRTFQKELLQSFNRIKFILAPVHCLWLELPADFGKEKENLKEKSRLIKDITILPPEADDCSVFFKAVLKTEEQSFFLKLKAMEIKDREFNKSDFEAFVKNYKKELPGKIKSFRLGTAVEKGAFARAISQSVWVKL